jgi:alkanesulfonate monooxygenase SsuD/methylene tetrahydromethanopterin reductase-like flavin-dependent oxidoreductase (luciferase family)
MRDIGGILKMKFVLFDLMSNHPNGVTGEILTRQERIQEVINQAVFAEELGFDGYGVAERHGAPFLSSSPAVMLTAIAARTSKIRLMPTV